MRSWPGHGVKPLHWIASSKRDLELVRERLKAAAWDYEARYGKEAD